MGQIKRKSLLVATPSPYVNESLRGYVLRLSETNGYERPNGILRVAGCTENEIRSSKVLVSSLYRALGSKSAELERIAYSDNEAADKRHFKLCGKYVHSMHLQTKVSQICPECVSESDHIHAFYDLRYAVACPKHGRYTLSICPSCKRTLTPIRPGLLRCKCGYDLSGERGSLVENTAIMGLLAFLWGQLSSDDIFLNDVVTKGLPVSDLKPLEFNVLLGLVLRLGRVTTGEKRYSDGTRSTVDAAGMSLANWPNGLYRYLEKFHGNTGIEQKSLGFRTQFSKFYDSLTKSNLPDEAVGFIVDALTTFGADHWKRSVTIRKNKSVTSHPKAGDIVGVDHTARFMGVQPQTVRKLVTEGVITPVVTTSSKAGMMLFELGEHLPKRLTEGNSLGAREAAKTLGLPVKVLYSLRRMGVFRVKYLGSKVNSFHEYDVEAFRRKLTSSRSIVNDGFNGDDVVTVREAMLMKTGGPDSKAFIIKELIEGGVMSYIPDESGVPDIQLRRSDVKRVVRDAQEFIDGYVTRVRAAELVGCSPSVIKWLLENEFLRKKNGCAQLRISVNSINEFNSKNIPCSVLAANYHTSTPRVERMCRELNIHLLYAKRDCGDSFQPFLAREDVATIDEMWMRVMQT